MNSILGEVSHFDQFSGVFVRAVLKPETSTGSNAETQPKKRLYEVWILPEDSSFFSEKILLRMCFDTMNDLARFFDTSTCPEDRVLHAVRKQMELLVAFAQNITHSQAVFHYCVHESSDGPVVKVVFGDSRSMASFQPAMYWLEPEGD